MSPDIFCMKYSLIIDLDDVHRWLISILVQLSKQVMNSLSSFQTLPGMESSDRNGIGLELI